VGHVEAARLIFALSSPWLLGVAGLRLLWRDVKEPGDWPTILGYGYFLGILSTTVVMRLQDALGLRQSFLTTALTLLALIVLCVWFGRNLRWRRHTNHCIRRVGHLEAGLVWLLLALLAARFIGLGLEVFWRPLYPWDAWVNWAPKARVWYEIGTLVPFVSPDRWLQGDSLAGAYTLGNWGAWRYPPTVPLIQLWMALGIGRWDDAWMNLPWVLAAVALGLGFYGQSRLWGVSPLYTMLFTYFLLSMPLLDTHVGLAGYADLWMACFYGLATFAFIQWSRSRDVRQGLLALVFALGGTQIKVPGAVWLLTFFPALLVSVLPRRALLTMLCAGAVGVAVLAVSGKWEGAVPWIGTAKIGLDGIELPYIGSYHFHFHAVWQPFWRNQFLFDNWHLFWYSLWAMLLVTVPRTLSVAWVRGATVLVASAVAFIGWVFFFTDKYVDAIDYTTINRAALHVIPTLCFYGLVVFWERFFAGPDHSFGSIPAPGGEGSPGATLGGEGNGRSDVQ
jgi:hypothetical protein